jgi:hypothetical protein
VAAVVAGHVQHRQQQAAPRLVKTNGHRQAQPTGEPLGDVLAVWAGRGTRAREHLSQISAIQRREGELACDRRARREHARQPVAVPEAQDPGPAAPEQRRGVLRGARVPDGGQHDQAPSLLQGQRERQGQRAGRHGAARQFDGEVRRQAVAGHGSPLVAGMSSSKHRAAAHPSERPRSLAAGRPEPVRSMEARKSKRSSTSSERGNGRGMVCGPSV